MIAVVAAAHPDGAAPASGVQLLVCPLLTPDEIAEARSVLMASGQLRTVSDGWKPTARAQKPVRQLPGQRAPEAAS